MQNMQEYWVNVYEGNLNSINWPTKCDAKNHSLRVKAAGVNTIYRIHVKMKPVKSIKTTGREILKRTTGKFNWMGS